MFRVLIVLLVMAIGLTTGALVGLLGGAALVEFGKQSCTGSACADIVIRTCVPIAAAVGAALGLAKGINMVSASRVSINS